MVFRFKGAIFDVMALAIKNEDECYFLQLGSQLLFVTLEFIEQPLLGINRWKLVHFRQYVSSDVFSGYVS